MKRRDWTFSKTAKEVSDAAQERANHHKEREAWWQAELNIADSKLRQDGVQFRSVAVSGGDRLDVVLDPGLQARLNECRSKVREHKDDAEEYAQWVRTLAVNPNQTLQLDHEDMEYFGF